jgi:ubiquinone biosynthesis protein COQ9
MDEQAMRDRLVEAMLPDVPFDGWSRHTLAAAGGRVGVGADDLAVLFPNGARDAVAAFSHWADRKTLDALAQESLEGRKLRERIALGIRTRQAILLPHREAVRRAASFLALPQHVPLGLKLLYDTVDALWYAAGDSAADFSFYTKRATLAALYAATTFYWLDDRSPDGADTDAFVERRLDDLMALPRAGARLRTGLDSLPNPIRMMRTARR